MIRCFFWFKQYVIFLSFYQYEQRPPGSKGRMKRPRPPEEAEEASTHLYSSIYIYIYIYTYIISTYRV